ncbi:protein YLS3-like [Quercus lobata]|uniref:protein YLS3-like n=1 Tax=Quercus lobata TaxID=97700 RepID=UPI0012442599|nr:protein YLS3-like [Quercus lobata]
MVSYAIADAAKDRIVCKATGRAGYKSALRWWSGKSIYPQTVAVSNKSKDNKKRMCIIIRDRNDPELGLQINITLTFGLSSIFHAPSNQSDSSPAPSPSGGGSSTSAKSKGTNGQVCNGNCHWRGPNMVFLQFTPVHIGTWIVSPL